MGDDPPRHAPLAGRRRAPGADGAPLSRPRLPLWVVVGILLAAYVGVPAAGFVWDDHGLLEHNLTLDQPTFTRVWQRDLWCCVGTNTTGYYRPLLTVTLLLDRALFGLDAAGPHVQSLLWHVLVVIAVASLLRPRVGADRAAVAALIFGLHPIQSEAVIWVSARNDPMAAAGVLGALIALDRRRYALAALATLGACLSKENAFLLPAVAWLWRRAWDERLGRADLLALGAGIGAALLLRSQATLGGFGLDQGDIAFSARSAFYGAVRLAGWLVWPWPLTATASLYAAPPGPFVYVTAVATIALLVALVAAGGRRAACLLLLGGLVLAPSALGVRWYSTLGERYLYLPMFGVAAALVSTVPARRAWAALGVGLAVVSLAVLHVRVPEWADEEALFSAAVRRAPDPFSWNLLGVELYRQHRWAEAGALFDAALLGTPSQHRACRHIVEAADHTLDDHALLEQSRVWFAHGCRGTEEFDAPLAMAFAARGLWEPARELVDGMRRADPRARDAVVRAGLAAIDGDLTALSTYAVSWPGGPADLLAQVSLLTNEVHRSPQP